jgi:D-beta-D-heptose 7-phosphate kinase/D-beta-D-heptose 1-phosphate adenosyltransferase
MTTTNPLAALDRFEKAKVLCVGDVMLDRYIHGSVTRISPEAPIPVLKIDRETMMLGGAGNVINNIAALGGTGYFATVIGADEAGKSVTGLIETLSDANSLIVDKTRPTTIKTRFVSGSQQLLRADQEIVGPVSEEAEEALISYIDKIIGSVGAVIISDYAKGVVSARLAAAVIAAARKHSVPVIVDSKIDSYSRFKGASVLKPNRRELSLATGMPAGSDAEVTAAARMLIATTGVEAVIATRSEQGMSVVTNAKAVHLHTLAQEVFDVSGAGDTVAASLGLALASGASLVEAAEIANHAAGIVVGKIGTASVRLSELRTALQHPTGKPTEKIKTREDAIDEAERWRTRGLRIGFTNGCFDILHPGHIALIAEARHACDRLILGLNSDNSVKRLKGEGRPVNTETARAQVLAALADVDAVVIFDEDTPLDIITHLRPDVLIKGADYTAEQVVGADFVKSYGGKLVLAKIKEGHSTTATIKRMQS